MRFGLCTDIESAEIAATAGYDYIELPLAASLAPEAEVGRRLHEIRDKLTADSIDVEAFNVLMAGDVFCVGPNADPVRLSRYFESAFGRAAAVGGKIVVFGSGSQRRIPDGWPEAPARDQFLDALRQASDWAEEFGITIALEPLNHTETNLVLSVAEGMSIVRALDHPALRVLSDLYHIEMEHQPFAETSDAGSLLAHVHVAGSGRRAPIPDDLPLLTDYLRAVRAAGYDERVSVECRWTNLETEAAGALTVLKDAWAQASPDSA